MKVEEYIVTFFAMIRKIQIFIGHERHGEGTDEHEEKNHSCHSVARGICQKLKLILASWADPSSCRDDNSGWFTESGMCYIDCGLDSPLGARGRATTATNYRAPAIHRRRPRISQGGHSSISY